jgi:hypothetical protein
MYFPQSACLITRFLTDAGVGELEKMLTYANHVGLYSEEIDPRGHQIGNFPQAFTHLALLHAAIDLDAALNTRGATVFQGPGGLGLPTVLNLAAGRALHPGE